MREMADSSSFGARRLGDEGKCSSRQAMMPVFIERQHLHRNVARSRVLFQVIENGPAQHVGQEDVERNRSGMEFARQCERFRAAQCDQNLESLIAREIAQHPRIVRIVFDNEQHSIVRLQIVAIIGNLLDGTLRDDDVGKLQRSSRR